MNKIKQIGLTAVVVATTAVGSAVADPVEIQGRVRLGQRLYRPVEAHQ